jgi:hypothetical protein
MSQSFAPLQGTDTLTASRVTLNNNMDALQSAFAGTSFPTVNITVGMTCYRTDLQKTFRLRSVGPATWVLSDNLNAANNYTRFQYTAAQGQTTFSGIDSAGLTLTYTAGYTEVAVNGQWLMPIDYTATDGVSIVFASGLNAGASVYVQSMAPFNVADTLALSQNGADITNKAGFKSNILAVGYDAQSLTAAQQAQAATNIGAAPYDAQASNNIFINGGMEVDQANGGAAIVPTTSYVVDGWGVTKAGTMVLGAQQVSDAPPGFSNSLKVTVSTAQAALGANDYALVYQFVEGYRSSKLQFGSSSAQSVTLGFWTKIHRVGGYSGVIRNSTATRSYVFNFTQNVADAWEYKTVTIPGETTGTWVGNTNASALQLFFCIGTGTTFAGAAGAWIAANLLGSTGTTNGVAATTDVFQVTGVTLLPGTIASTAAQSVLLKRSFDVDLQLCKRYYNKLGGELGADIAIQGYVPGASTAFSQCISLPVSMRAPPAVSAQGVAFGTQNLSAINYYSSKTTVGVQLISAAAGVISWFSAAGSFLVLDSRL